MATGQGDGQAGVWHLQLWGRPSHAGLHWQNLQKPHSCLHDQSKITLMGKVSIRYCRFKEKSQTKNIPLGKVSIHNKIKLVLGKVSNYKIKNCSNLFFNWSLFSLLTNWSVFFLPRMRVPFSWSLRPGQLWGVWGVWRGRNWHSETCGYLSVTKGVRSIISQRLPLKQRNGLGYLFIQNILNAFSCFKEEDMKQFECSEFFVV